MESDSAARCLQTTCRQWTWSCAGGYMPRPDSPLSSAGALNGPVSGNVAWSVSQTLQDAEVKRNMTVQVDVDSGRGVCDEEFKSAKT